MEYRIGKYHWKTTEKDNAVFWANDEFWNAWPKLAQAGYMPITANRHRQTLDMLI